METIYDYVRAQKVKYAKEIELADGWQWGMKEHLRRSFLYKNSQFYKDNQNRTLRPNRNIILAILNVQYRTEGFDVKDIELYVNDPKEFYKSFLVKKFHNKWAPENEIDTFIDELVESYCDYGGTLVQKKENTRPQVVDLRTIAFCNQTNILAYPFGIRHTFSFSQLRAMKNWGVGTNGATIGIERLIVLAKKEDKDEVEVFETHGNMPVEWMAGHGYYNESELDVPQVQIITYFKDEKNQEQGETLFRHREPKLLFKFLARDQIKNRALGRGGIEELFEPQQWTNWTEGAVMEMLEAASKIIPVTDDPSIASQHPSGMKGMENLAFLQIGEGKSVKAFDNVPRNLPAFNEALTRWREHAQILGSATDPLLGEEPSAGTPFKLFEAQQIEAKGMHKYRQGKIATFMDEIYRDWILPHISKEIVKGTKFLAEISSDEMQEISEQIAENLANRIRNEQVLNGEIPDDKELLKQDIITKFSKRGNKQFIEILKDEMTDAPLDVMTNIAGKQKNLALLTDKLVNVLRQYIATPQIRQDPGMAKLLNTILESSGLSPIMFNPVPVAQAPAQGGTEALQDFSQDFSKAQERVPA